MWINYQPQLVIAEESGCRFFGLFCLFFVKNSSGDGGRSLWWIFPEWGARQGVGGGWPGCIGGNLWTRWGMLVRWREASSSTVSFSARCQSSTVFRGFSVIWGQQKCFTISKREHLLWKKARFENTSRRQTCFLVYLYKNFQISLIQSKNGVVFF